MRDHLYPDMRYAVIPPFLAVAFISVVAEAHIRLDVPKGRYLNDPQQNTKQKQGPCGVSNDTRTTTADLITTFEPGETVTVEWNETINHPGHFRIAFSEKGQVFPAPTVDPMPVSAQILADDILDDKSGGKFSHAVTLPNVTCDTCTLQLIQVMSDSSTFYFQCADLILKASGSGGAGGTTGSGGTSTAGAGGQGSAGKASAGAGGRVSTGGAPGAGGISGGSPSAGGSGGSGGTLAASGGTPVVPMPMAGSGGASGGTGGARATGGTSTGGNPATPSAGGTPSAPATGGTQTTAPGGSGPSPAEEEGGCGMRAPRGNTALALLAMSSAAALLRRRRVKSAARR